MSADTIPAVSDSLGMGLDHADLAQMVARSMDRIRPWPLTYVCGCSFRSLVAHIHKFDARFWMVWLLLSLGGSIDRSIFGHLWMIGHTRCVLLASILVSIINFARKPIARMLARCDPRRTLLRSLGCLVASQRSLGYYLLLLAWVFLFACMLARESILLGPRLEAALPNVQGKKEAIQAASGRRRPFRKITGQSGSSTFIVALFVAEARLEECPEDLLRFVSHGFFTSVDQLCW